VKIVIVGAGGHARSVLDALRTGSAHTAVAFTDPDASRHGTELDGVPIVGDDEQLGTLREQGVEGAALGVGGVRDNAMRARLCELADRAGFALPTLVHGSAHVSEQARLGRATVVLAGAVIGPGAVLGRNVIVNSAAVVEHDVVVEDDVHIATAAALGGAVTVGRAAHIGLGARVIQGARIGARAVVGAGAAVVRDVEPDTVVVGVPARTLHQTGKRTPSP
jgi:sugar O-acyltransferase (sialic acid O-acetyltransferase NeuD family)